MGLIQRIDTTELREGIDAADAVPCPMCGKRHRVGLVGESGMTEECFRSLMAQRQQVRDQVAWLERYGDTG
jgi:hypothetical protein